VWDVEHENIHVRDPRNAGTRQLTLSDPRVVNSASLDAWSVHSLSLEAIPCIPRNLTRLFIDDAYNGVEWADLAAALPQMPRLEMLALPVDCRKNASSWARELATALPGLKRLYVDDKARFEKGHVGPSAADVNLLLRSMPVLGVLCVSSMRIDVPLIESIASWLPPERWGRIRLHTSWVSEYVARGIRRFYKWGDSSDLNRSERDLIERLLDPLSCIFYPNDIIHYNGFRHEKACTIIMDGPQEYAWA
jgi:hypothetical protein